VNAPGSGDAPPARAVIQGKVMLVSLCTLVLLASMGVSLLILVMRGPVPFVGSAVRFVLTAVLLGFVFAGYAWARWLAAVLFALSSLVGFFLAVVLIMGPGAGAGDLPILGLTGLHTLMFAALVVPSPMTQYLHAASDRG
jgi:hypothetical protein